MDEIYVGSKIKHLREIKGWTQQALADRAGVSRSYLGELERDVSQPTISVLKRIADAFEVPLDMFLEDTKLLPLQALEDYFPEDVREFLRDREGLPYLELAVEAKRLEVSPELLKSIIQAIRADRDKLDKD